MSKKDFDKTPSDAELKAFEKEELRNIQASYGHMYTPSYETEENEIDIIMKHTKEVIQECEDGKADLSLDAETIGREILTRSNKEMMLLNQMIRDNGFKYRRVKQLPPKAVAELLISNKDIIIRKIRTPAVHMEGDRDQYIPAVRTEEGIFSYLMKDGANEQLNSLIRRYNPNASKRFIAEVYAAIKDSEWIQKVSPTMDEELVPVNNGVWNFDIWKETHDRTKAFISNTDPGYDKYTFTTKIPIDYDPNAESPVIHNDDDGTDWEVMTWIDQIFNQDGKHPLLTKILLEIIHCAVRIFTCFGRGIFFLDESKYSKGGQGKGTFCQLLRGLVGEDRCKDAEVYHLEDPKKLSGLERCNAIIADEASHHYIKHCANYKRLQRGEPVSVKTLYKDEYTAVFKGLILHCLNEPLTFAERTGSVERTRVVVTWKTSYTDRSSGIKERRYIKEDYVRRPEVLQYLLKYTLEEMDITEFSKECLDEVEPNLQIVRNRTNAVAEFMNEYEEEFVWDRVPFKFLFDAFVAWYTDTHCQRPQYKLSAFIEDVALWAEGSKIFEFHPKSFRPCGFMDDNEPLIKEFGLGHPWITSNSMFTRYGRGERPLYECKPEHDKNTTYREGGLFRKGIKGTSTYKGLEWDESGYTTGHPALVGYCTDTYVDGKKKKYYLHKFRIQRKFFSIDETKTTIDLSPVNKADIQDDIWPVRLYKEHFLTFNADTEFWLVPRTIAIDEKCCPIREAIDRITGDNKEDPDEQK
jgi:Predicted ATPase